LTIKRCEIFCDSGGSLAWRELGGVNGDLRCGKGTTYEGGHRVPLIARWPGKIAPNTIISELTSSLDWLPTLVNLAGLDLPHDRTIDGVDMHDVLFGQGPTKRTEFLYFEWRTATLMAVRINNWKLHVQTRGSHCSPPFPDANCYDFSFRTLVPNVNGSNASCVHVEGGETPAGCITNSSRPGESFYPCKGGSHNCVPMLVNLDTDPGEAQLQTLVCNPGVTPGVTPMPGAAPNPDGALEPRCFTKEVVDPVLASLWALYNKHVSQGNPAVTDGERTVWAPSEIHKGGNAAERFPCCDPSCSPKPYCCSCKAAGNRGTPAPTKEQHTKGEQDAMWFQETFQQDGYFM
jgi:hypothetical protein